MRIVDIESGRTLGRALFIPWRGKIHVIGLDATVRPIFLPQKRLTYWKQEIGFMVHPSVDFPREGPVSDEIRSSVIDETGNADPKPPIKYG